MRRLIAEFRHVKNWKDMFYQTYWEAFPYDKATENDKKHLPENIETLKLEWELFNKIHNNLLYLASINGGRFPNVKSTETLLGRLAIARQKAEKALLEPEPEPVIVVKKKTKRKVRRKQHPNITPPNDTDTFIQKILKIIKSHYKDKIDMEHIKITRKRLVNNTLLLHVKNVDLELKFINKIMIQYEDKVFFYSNVRYSITLMDDDDEVVDEFEIE